MPALRDRWVLHFTHVDNVPAIARSGVLLSDARARAEASFTEVGDVRIKGDRRTRPVRCGPGGVVGDYVPFYFAPRSPMMFRVACDCRDTVPGRYIGGDRPLVYFVFRVRAIMDAGLDWVGTDGNAAAAVTEFTDDPARLERIVDWPLMMDKYWRDTTEDPDRQRRRSAELLVHSEVPVALAHQIATYSGDLAVRVAEVLRGHQLARSLVVRPNWYYGYRPRG